MLNKIEGKPIIRQLSKGIILKVLFQNTIETTYIQF